MIRSKKVEIELLESRRLLSAAADLVAVPDVTLRPAAAPGVDGYSPQQIRHAYGFDQVTFSGGNVAGDGTGQTIAIVDAYNDPKIAADLNTFDRQFGLANPPSFRVVNQAGGTSLPQTDSGWASEISLDVEWAHAIAPKANLLLVEANSDSLDDLLTAVDYARRAAGVSVVSMSWGGGEFWGQTQYDNVFTTPAGHGGVTFVAASGDEGARWGPEWPASSPNVLAVGGTSLGVSASGVYSSESGWRYSTGGVSYFENEPSYQSGVQSTGGRSAPDVSYNADQYTGFAVYDSVPDQGYVGWSVVGGTSAGAPQWAGLVAIADQGRALQRASSLDGTHQTLPMLYAMPAINFHDVVGGGGGRGWFRASSATTGYDIVTGRGSPVANRIIAALVGQQSATVTVALSHQLQRPSGANSRPAVFTQGHDPDADPTPVPVSGPAPVTVSNPPPVAVSAQPTPVIAAPTPAAGSPLDSLARVGALAGVPGPLAVSTAGAARVLQISSSAITKPAAQAVASAAAAHSVFSTVGIYAEEALAASAAARDVAGAAPAAAVEAARGAAEKVTGTLAGAGLLPEAAAHAMYNFVHLDPSALAADAVAVFAREAATLATGGVGDDAAPSHPGRAWAVTAGVLAVDAAMIGYWYTQRRRVGQQRKQSVGPSNGYPYKHRLV